MRKLSFHGNSQTLDSKSVILKELPNKILENIRSLKLGSAPKASLSQSEKSLIMEVLNSKSMFRVCTCNPYYAAIRSRFFGSRFSIKNFRPF